MPAGSIILPIITINANANNSRGYAFYGPLNWSLEGTDPGIGFDGAARCGVGNAFLLITTLFFVGFCSFFGFDYIPFMSWLICPSYVVFFALFAWAMAIRTRRCLSEPRFYPRRKAIAESVGYGILLALGAAYAAVFVRCAIWTTERGTTAWAFGSSDPFLFMAWLSVFFFYIKAVDRGANERIRAIVIDGKTAGCIGKGQMGPEIKNFRKHSVKAWAIFITAMAVVFAVEFLWMRLLGWF